MKRKEDLISSEIMGGWPIFKMNIREIFEALGAVEKDGFIGLDLNDPKLELYPLRLTDDCMNYGVDAEWIVSVDSHEDYINIFTEKELPKEELEQLKKELYGNR